MSQCEQFRVVSAIIQYFGLHFHFVDEAGRGSGVWLLAGSRRRRRTLGEFGRTIHVRCSLATGRLIIGDLGYRP